MTEMEDGVPKKLDYCRECKDTKTQFLNISVAVGNTILWGFLLIVIILVNESMLCVPSTTWLSQSNNFYTSDGCNLSNIILSNDSMSEQNSTHLLEEVVDKQNKSSQIETIEIDQNSTDIKLFSFNVVTIGTIFSFGFTSILISLSKFWIPTLQNLRQVREWKGLGSLQIDSIKAIITVFATCFFLIYWIPISISVSLSSPRLFKLNVVNVIVWIIGPPLLFISYYLMKVIRNKLRQHRARKSLAQQMNGCDRCVSNRYTRLVSLITGVAIALGIMVTCNVFYWLWKNSFTSEDSNGSVIYDVLSIVIMSVVNVIVIGLIFRWLWNHFAKNNDVKWKNRIIDIELEPLNSKSQDKRNQGKMNIDLTVESYISMKNTFNLYFNVCIV